MILLALALAQTAVPAAPATRAEHATAIGEQLKTWRASWRTRAGKTTCVTTRSSGDIAIDAVGCASLTACADQHTPRVIALARDKAITAAARKSASQALNAEFAKCMTARRDTLIADLAEKRAAAGPSGS